jgi:ATP-dependent protease HslVU (ClpYQ) peptidase subunit
MFSDYQIARPGDEFAAVGCGEDIALGAMYATRHLPPAKRIEMALEAAERFSAGVRGPFITLDAA